MLDHALVYQENYKAGCCLLLFFFFFIWNAKCSGVMTSCLKWLFVLLYFEVEFPIKVRRHRVFLGTGSKPRVSLLLSAQICYLLWRYFDLSVRYKGLILKYTGHHGLVSLEKCLNSRNFNWFNLLPISIKRSLPFLSTVSWWELIIAVVSCRNN